jgi:hypothetical protein
MFNGILNLIIQIVEAISGPIYLFLNVIFGDSCNIFVYFLNAFIMERN